MLTKLHASDQPSGEGLEGQTGAKLVRLGCLQDMALISNSNTSPHGTPEKCNLVQSLIDPLRLLSMSLAGWRGSGRVERIWPGGEDLAGWRGFGWVERIWPVRLDI